MPATALFITLSIAAAAAIVAAGRRRQRRVLVALAVSALAAFLAAADIHVPVGRRPVIAVLIDASPSTRGLWFREMANVRGVATRLASTLAHDASLRFWTFGDGDVVPLNGNSIIEIADNQTSLPHVDADAVFLFSDGQLEPRDATAPPIFPIVAADTKVGDARIVDVEHDSEDGGDQIVVAIANDGPPRSLLWPDGQSSPVPHGSVRLARDVANQRGTIRLNAGDAWPENDVAEIGPATSFASERWWIGRSAPPEGYRAVDPRAIPPADAWLAARQVVIDNMPADAIDPATTQSLSRYVQDLGGSLVIVGGDRAFSAGGYAGTALDALSPLASSPPDPRNEWLVLIDASGSMATRAADGRSRLDISVDAAAAVVAALPGADRVAIASFARELRVWPARSDHRLITPTDLVANGPTNLRAAIDAVLATRGTDESALPLHIIALTDGDADLGETNALREAFAMAGATMHWVALDSGTSKPLADLARSTGGSVIEAGAPSTWKSRAAIGARALEVIPVKSQPMMLRWTSDFAALDGAAAAQANTTFPRSDIATLATQTPATSSTSPILAARWNVGSGRVAALAYAAPPEAVERVGESIETPPRDPRFAVRWEGDRVWVDAADGGASMNALTIDLCDPGSTEPITTLKQTAPGRYGSSVPRFSYARTLLLRIAGRAIDVHAMAALASKEFEAIGLKRDGLAEVAARTGGRVLDANEPPAGPPIIQRREVSLSGWLLALALAAASFAVVSRRSILAHA